MSVIIIWFYCLYSALVLIIYASDRNNPYMDIGHFTFILRNLLYKYATGIIAQTEIAKEIL